MTATVLTGPMLALQEALASNVAFQTWAGFNALLPPTIADVKTHILIGERKSNRDTIPNRAFIAICPAPSGIQYVQVGVQDFFPQGLLRVLVYGKTANAYIDDPAGAEVDANDSLATLMSAIASAAGTDTSLGRIVLREPLQIATRPRFLEAAEGPEHRFEQWDAVILVGYGAGPG